jgi:hypothetical protein
MVVLLFTFPDSASRDEGNFFAATGRTGHAIRPAQIGEKINAVIQVGEVPDCLSQGLREG